MDHSPPPILTRHRWHRPIDEMKVPREILDKIFIHFHDDTFTLVSCSQVSRQFLPSAHRLLFSTLTYWADRSVSSFTPLVEFLQSSKSGRVRRYIRSLSIWGRYLESRHNVQPADLPASQLRAMLESLPFLQHVDIHGVRPYNDEVLPTGPFRSLQSLMLVKIHKSFRTRAPPNADYIPSDVDGIHTILSQLSDVRKLELSCLAFTQSDFSRTDIQMRPSTLNIEDCVGMDIFTKCVAAPFWDNLTSISWKLPYRLSETKDLIVPSLLNMRIELERTAGTFRYI